MPDISRLQINHQIGQYDIFIGSGILGQLNKYLTAIDAQAPIGFITNKKVNDLYGAGIREGLKTAGRVTRTILIPDGEEYKTLASVEQVISALIAQGMERSGTLITLGGGVTTDLGGFVASILFRGIRLVHIPTTLLAMVDASVGGKTGVNHSRGKNLIGSFYQPDLVIMDVSTLKTIDPRDRISGYAEMLKTGLVRDIDYFEFLTAHFGDLMSSDPHPALEKAIVRSCQLKAEVVEADEKEANLRRILNFGHTLGHAIETTLGYGVVRHGEAVILGMYGAGWLSTQIGSLSEEEWSRLSQILLKIPIPFSLNRLDPTAVEQATQLDKKVEGSQLHFVLLHTLGEARIQTGIPSLMIKLAVEAIKKAWSN